MAAANLSLLRVGSRVKLRGPNADAGEPVPAKPYPLGWRKVEYTDGDATTPTRNVVVTSDTRWIPVALIEEVK